jgi:hypothetical protein
MEVGNDSSASAPPGAPTAGRIRRVEIREPENELDAAVDLAIAGLFLFGTLNAANGLPFLSWVNRARPSPFFELGPTWVIATHYSRRETLGARIHFAQVTRSHWSEGANRKHPSVADFHWYLDAGPELSAIVDGPTLGKVISEREYVHELRQLMRFAHHKISERLGPPPA